MKEEAMRFGLTMNVSNLSEVTSLVLDKLLSMVEDVQPSYEAIIVRIDLTFVHAEPDAKQPPTDPSDISF